MYGMYVFMTPIRSRCSEWKLEPRGTQTEPILVTSQSTKLLYNYRTFPSLCYPRSGCHTFANTTANIYIYVYIALCDVANGNGHADSAATMGLIQYNF